MRPNLHHPVFVVVALLVGSGLAQPGLADGRAQAKRLIKSLSARSFKVRLKAAIVIGKQKVTAALPALRKIADKQTEKPTVRAAAIISLAQMTDEPSRRRFAYLLGHENELIAKASEKALLMLDRAQPQEPVYLVSVKKPKLPKGVPASRGERLMHEIKRRIDATGGLVPGGGEEEFLDQDELAEHLEKRKLDGLLLRPELVELVAKAEGGRTTVVGQVRIAVYGLVDGQRTFLAEGGADAWIEDQRITRAERTGLENEVLDGAVDSAWMQVVQDLSSRGAE